MFKGEPLYDFDPVRLRPEKIITPVSRTFIPSRVTDNYFYVKSGYIATLQSMPEPLRSQMLEGDFNAGVEDDEWQVIPTVGSTLQWPAGSPATPRARWTRSAAIRRWAARTSSSSLPGTGHGSISLSAFPG
jgi:hypothetical protein